MQLSPIPKNRSLVLVHKNLFQILKEKFTNPDNIPNIMGLAAIWIFGMIILVLHEMYQTDNVSLFLFLQFLSPFIGWFIAKYFNKVVKFRGHYYNRKKEILKLPKRVFLVPVLGFLGLFTWFVVFVFCWDIAGIFKILWATLIPNTIAYGYYIAKEFPVSAISLQDRDPKYDIKEDVNNQQMMYSLNKRGLFDISCNLDHHDKYSYNQNIFNSEPHYGADLSCMNYPQNVHNNTGSYGWH